jgi:hypothetical protein
MVVGYHSLVLLNKAVIIAGSSKGRTHPSGGCYLGSSPGPAALLDC